MIAALALAAVAAGTAAAASASAPATAELGGELGSDDAKRLEAAIRLAWGEGVRDPRKLERVVVSALITPQQAASLAYWRGRPESEWPQELAVPTQNVRRVVAKLPGARA